MRLTWDIKAVLILVFLGVMGLLWGAFEAHEAAVYQRGHDAAMHERDVADAKHRTADILAEQEKERKHIAAMDAAESLRLKQKADDEKDKNDAVRIARAGGSGMRCPVRTEVRIAPDSASTGPAPAPGPTQDGQLLPEAAGDILDIAGTHAQDMRDYNALLDEYQRLRAFVNSPR